jgi:hypothetical protein
VTGQGVQLRRPRLGAHNFRLTRRHQVVLENMGISHVYGDDVLILCFNVLIAFSDRM